MNSNKQKVSIARTKAFIDNLDLSFEKMLAVEKIIEKDEEKITRFEKSISAVLNLILRQNNEIIKIVREIKIKEKK